MAHKGHILTGVVTSDKSDKTIVITVTTNASMGREKNI